MGGMLVVSDAAASETNAVDSSEAPAASLLMREFLAWLARTPRTYAETMAAWRTSCPRQAVWEDALAEGFVRADHRRGTPAAEAPVVITARGRSVLDGPMPS